MFSCSPYFGPGEQSSHFVIRYASCIHTPMSGRFYSNVRCSSNVSLLQIQCVGQRRLSLLQIQCVGQRRL